MDERILLGVLLLVVAISFWRPLRRRRAFLRVRQLVWTGHAFLALGLVLGLLAGDTRAVIADVGPIVGFVSGWLGFAAGMRYDARVLRTVAPRAFAVAMAPALAAGAVVGGLGALVLLLPGAGPREDVAGAIVLACAGASSGPTLAAVVRTRRAGRSARARAMLRLVEFSAGMDDAVVLLLALGGFAALSSASAALGAPGLSLVALGGAALLGVLTWLFLGGPATPMERLLLGLGMLVFISGFGEWLELVPATVGALAAATLANLPGDRMAQLFSAVRRVERPAVVILMVLVGFAVTEGVHWSAALLFVLLVPVRLLAKVAAGDRVATALPGPQGLACSPRWGLGLAPQGALSLVVALGFVVTRDGVAARTILAAVAAGALTNELLAPSLLGRALRRLAPPARREEAP